MTVTIWLAGFSIFTLLWLAWCVIKIDRLERAVSLYCETINSMDDKVDGFERRLNIIGSRSDDWAHQSMRFRHLSSKETLEELSKISDGIKSAGGIWQFSPGKPPERML